MKKQVVVIGVGEIGGVFAKGMLRTGRPVYPVVRGVELSAAAAELSDPEAVIVAVGEKDINNVLNKMPEEWRDRLVLVQNELLPRDWLAHNLDNPTVISVWFEKKPGQDPKVIIPSPVYGPKAGLVNEALGALKISCRVLSNPNELTFELVMKNLYILTANIAGLKTGGTVGGLWDKHRSLAQGIANDVLDIQFKLIGTDLDREALMDSMVAAFNGDPDHKCMGRTAPARLARAIDQAEEFGIKADSIRSIDAQIQKSPV